MKRISVLLFALFFGVAASAQLNYTPRPVAAFTYSGSSWTAIAGSGTGTALGYVPDPVALYCYNSGTSKWVPADSTCFQSSNPVTWPSAAGIPNYNGSSAWGTSYSDSNPIPFSFLAGVQASGTYVTPTTLNNGTLPMSGTTITENSSLPLATTTGIFNYGTLGFSDSNQIQAFQGSVNAYLKNVLQNTSSGTGASTDYVVANNQATATTHYGNFGINSSTFSGTGPYSIAGATYLGAMSGDLSIGTLSANAIHLFYNNGATDTATIDSNGFKLPGLATTANTTPLCLNGTNGAASITGCLINATQVNGNTFPASAGFTSGGVPYFSSTSAMGSSALLTNHGLVIGGGAAAAPKTMAVCATNAPIIGQVGADPICGTILEPSTMTQWGIMYASTATQKASTAALTANALIEAGSSAAPSASSIIDDGKNITSTEIFVGGNKKFVTADFTDSTSGTLTAVTGLSFTLPTSKAVNVSFHCVLIFNQGTAAVSDSIGIGVTGTAPTQANAMGIVYPSASTVTSGNLVALASTTATAVVTFTPSAITTNWNAILDGTIEQPSNATPGVFNIYVSTTTGSDNLIVKRGSYCTLF